MSLKRKRQIGGCYPGHIARGNRDSGGRGDASSQAQRPRFEIRERGWHSGEKRERVNLISAYEIF
jgi:hypothetical protein